MNPLSVAHAVTAVGLALAAAGASTSASTPHWMLPLGLVVGAVGKGLASWAAREGTKAPAIGSAS